MPKGVYERSDETRRKISEAMKGDKNPLYGKCHSEKTKRKISEAGLGSKNSQWRGGRYKHGGYVMVHFPTHPYAGIDKYVPQHRLVMEAHLRRTLLPTEVVHHINTILDDNRIENLMLFNNGGDHTRYHGVLRSGKRKE